MVHIDGRVENKVLNGFHHFNGDGLNICNASHGAHFVHGLQEQLCVFFRPGRLVLHSGVDELALEEHISEILKASLIAVCGFFRTVHTLRPVSLGCPSMGLKCTTCVTGLPVALLASSLLVAAPALSRSHPIEVSMAVRSPEQGRVVLDLGRRQISVQRQGQTLGPWPVAIGDPKTPTPSGLFKVENMMMNPQYQSTKSGKLHPKRGPQSPLGHRWIGFLRSGPNQFGIHGTPWPHWVKTRSAVSNGCVRMLNAHVQQLYDHVEVGMAVEIMR